MSASLLSLAIFLVTASPVEASSGSTETLSKKELAEPFRQMERAAKAVKAYDTRDEQPVELRLLERSIHHYNCQPRASHGGTVWAWTRAGRPLALLALEGRDSRRMTYELVSLRTEPITFVLEGQGSWTPGAPSLELKPLPAAPTPANTKAERLLQMTKLARRFTAYEVWGKHYKLQLLPEPVHQWFNLDVGQSDGAVFFYAHGTNPEAVGLIECRRDDSGSPVWHYGFVPLAAAQLFVHLDDENIWTKPGGWHKAYKHGVLRAPRAAIDATRSGKPNTPGIVKPGNVALASNGATVSGVRADHAALLDGNTRTGNGYAWSPWPCEWTVTLDQVYRLQQIRLKLWDGDNRYYHYTVETSADGKKFEPLLDRGKGQWKSWQSINFPPRPMKAIRIHGLYNSINEWFHLTELEAYCLLPDGKMGGTVARTESSNPFSNVRFLDYIDRTWYNDIPNQFDVSEVDGGYRVTCDIKGGYERKLILFHKEDVFAKKLVASFTVERGSCGLDLRPRDLAPAGTRTHFAAGKKYDVQFWIEDGIAKGLINGEPASVRYNKPAYYGYFALAPSRNCSIVFHELRFEPHKIARTKTVELDTLKN